MNRLWVENKINTALEENIFQCSEVPKLFGQQNFSKLLDLIDELPIQDQEIIYSKNKRFNQGNILSNQDLNQNGLHIFRMLLSNLIYYDNVFDKDSEFYQHGYVIIDNFLDDKMFKRIKKMANQIITSAGDTFKGKRYWVDLESNHQLLYDFFDLPKCQELFKLVNATQSYEFHAKRVERLIHKHNDLQKFCHEDTFHPTVKFWYFYEDVEEKMGPTFYSKGSSVLNLARFKWEYDMSLIAHESTDKGTAEGSFRLGDEKQLINMGYEELKPIICSKNSLVVFNTMGWHKRGSAPEGTIRDSLMGIFRMDPFTL